MCAPASTPRAGCWRVPFRLPPRRAPPNSFADLGLRRTSRPGAEIAPSPAACPQILSPWPGVGCDPIFRPEVQITELMCYNHARPEFLTTDRRTARCRIAAETQACSLRRTGHRCLAPRESSDLSHRVCHTCCFTDPDVQGGQANRNMAVGLRSQPSWGLSQFSFHENGTVPLGSLAATETTLSENNGRLGLRSPTKVYDLVPPCA